MAGLGYFLIRAINFNLGIRTTSPTTGYKLDVIGAVRCESLTQYSSRDYKQDIETLAPSDYRDILKKLEQTEIFRFRYKEANENSRLRLGLIAEEAPEEVISHEGKGIDLGEAVAFLMAAVKAQAEEINGLKLEISGLKRN